MVAFVFYLRLVDFALIRDTPEGREWFYFRSAASRRVHSAIFSLALMAASLLLRLSSLSELWLKSSFGFAALAGSIGGATSSC